MNRWERRKDGEEERIERGRVEKKKRRKLKKRGKKQ